MRKTLLYIPYLLVFLLLTAGSHWLYVPLATSQTTPSSTAKKGETLKYDVQLDSKKARTIIIIIDLTSLDPTKAITSLQVPIEFVDQSGKTVGKKEFKFVDPEVHDSSLHGGQKYSRRFEYDDKAFQAVASVKTLPSSALVVTEVDAFSGAKPNN